MAQRLRLSRSSTSVSVFGVGGEKTAVAKGSVMLSFSPRNVGSAISVAALVFSRLTIYADGIEAHEKSWPYTQDLKLADSQYAAEDPIDVLLGTDGYALIIRHGFPKGGPSEPIAQETLLGWILSGKIEGKSSVHVAHTFQCRIEKDLCNLVRGLWKQEEIPITTNVFKEDQECEEHFVRSHSRKADGRYVVRLPIIAPLSYRDASHRRTRTEAYMETRFTWKASFLLSIRNSCSSTPL